MEEREKSLRTTTKNPIGSGGGQEVGLMVCFWNCLCACVITQKFSCQGRAPQEFLARSVTLLSSHGSLQVAGALMAFKCLTRAHTKNFRPRPQLGMLKESFTWSGSSY